MKGTVPGGPSPRLAREPSPRLSLAASRAAPFFAAIALAAACAGVPAADDPTDAPDGESAGTVGATSLTVDSPTEAPKGGERGRIESLLLLATPESLEAALRELYSEAISSDEAIDYRYATWSILSTVYPELAPLYFSGAPSSATVRIGALFAGETGLYAPETAYEAIGAAIRPLRDKTAAPELALAAAAMIEESGAPSVIPDLLKTKLDEYSGAWESVYLRAKRLLDRWPTCYAASIPLARALIRKELYGDALALVDAMPAAVREGLRGRKLRAEALYGLKRYQEADPLIIGVLIAEPGNLDFTLMRAGVLVAAGEYRQATPLLDAYGKAYPDDVRYLLLRSRNRYEGYRDRDGALTYIRRALAVAPDDPAVILYAAKILLAGSEEERAEGRSLARRASEGPSPAEALTLLLEDAVARGDWKEAASLLDRIAALPDSSVPYRIAFTVRLKSGDVAKATEAASAWRIAEPTSEDASIAWALVLVASGKRAQAIEYCNQVLSGKPSPKYRSRVYYVLSLVAADDAERLAYLRKALVDDAQNVEALVAIAEYYIRKGDYERARLYYKQAALAAPNDPAVIELGKKMESLPK
jgi:tetratricopeptide (TPR) repeat protein